jgi:hypothetical protein
MRYRKLRIAWSVGWGLVAVLLIVLWVRSYAHGGQLPSPPGMVFLSKNGVLAVLRLPVHTNDAGVTVWNHHPIAPIWPLKAEPADTRSGFFVQLRTWPNWALQSPYWFLVLLTGFLAAAPWIRWRFTRRENNFPGPRS